MDSSSGLTLVGHSPISQHQVVIEISDDETPTPPKKQTKRTADDTRTKSSTARKQHATAKVLDLDKRIKNKWRENPDQRLFLFYLRRRFDNDMNDITTLFNSTFQKHLASCGLPHGISKRTVDAQMSDPRTFQREDVSKVLEFLPFDKLATNFHRLDKLVRNAAQKMKITLIQRSIDDYRPVAKFSGKSKGKRAATVLSDLSTDMSDLGSDSENEVTPRPKKFVKVTSPRKKVQGPPSPPEAGPGLCVPMPFTPKRQIQQILPTPPNSGRSQTIPLSAARLTSVLGGIPTKDGKPFLLFRVWDEDSYGINGARGFTSGLDIRTDPPSETSPEFLQHAENHIEFSSQASPFISLTASLPTLLRKANTKNESAYIAIVDAQMSQDSKILYHVHSIVGALKGQRKLQGIRYFARFEFLAWSRIDDVVGHVSLAAFKQWADTDDCLGALLRKYDPTTMQVKKFQQCCKDSGIVVGKKLGKSVKSLARLFKIDGQQHIGHLADILLQNFNLANPPTSWRNSDAFKVALFGAASVDLQVGGLPHHFQSGATPHRGLLTPQSTPSVSRKAFEYGTLTVDSDETTAEEELAARLSEHASEEDFFHISAASTRTSFRHCSMDTEFDKQFAAAAEEDDCYEEDNLAAETLLGHRVDTTIEDGFYSDIDTNDEDVEGHEGSNKTTAMDELDLSETNTATLAASQLLQRFVRRREPVVPWPKLLDYSPRHSTQRSTNVTKTAVRASPPESLPKAVRFQRQLEISTAPDTQAALPAAPPVLPSDSLQRSKQEVIEGRLATPLATPVAPGPMLASQESMMRNGEGTTTTDKGGKRYTIITAKDREIADEDWERFW